MWQKKAIKIYDIHVCDMSQDHISIAVERDNIEYVYDIHELGYEMCPKCKALAPIVNFNFHEPKRLIKMCDCGYEAEVNKPELFRAFCRSQ